MWVQLPSWKLSAAVLEWMDWTGQVFARTSPYRNVCTLPLEQFIHHPSHQLRWSHWNGLYNRSPSPKFGGLKTLHFRPLYHHAPKSPATKTQRKTSKQTEPQKEKGERERERGGGWRTINTHTAQQASSFKKTFHSRWECSAIDVTSGPERASFPASGWPRSPRARHAPATPPLERGRSADARGRRRRDAAWCRAGSRSRRPGAPRTTHGTPDRSFSCACAFDAPQWPGRAARYWRRRRDLQPENI